MKKLVFAVVAAVAMVSVSNVFATSKISGMTSVAPVDTVAPSDTIISETPAQPTPAPADTAATTPVAE